MSLDSDLIGNDHLSRRSSEFTPKSRANVKKRFTLAAVTPKEIQNMHLSPEHAEGLKDLEMLKSAGKLINGEGLKKSKAVAKIHRRVTSLANLVLGDEDEETDEQSSEECVTQTNGEAMVNIMNNCLGSGMLGMGFALAQTGLVVGFVCIVGSALLNKYTLLLNRETCRIANCDPASTAVGKKAFGKSGQILMVFMFTCLGFFCMVSYVDASADAIVGLCALFLDESTTPAHSTITIVAWVVLLLPPTLIRSLKGVAVMSFIAFMGAIVMLIAVFCSCGKTLAAQGLPAVSEIRLFPEDMASFLNAFPILLLVFSIQAGGGVVLATMQDTSNENVNKVCNRSYLCVFVMDCFIGTIAYITFLSESKGNVLLNFPADDPFAVVARFALLDLVVLSYMIMIIPCKISLIDLFFGKNEALQEASTCQFYGTTLVLNVLALGMALSVSDLSLVLGLNGAICTNFVAFLMPAAFFIKIRANPDDKSEEAVPICSLRNIPYYLLFVFGMFSLCLSGSQMAAKTWA